MGTVRPPNNKRLWICKGFKIWKYSGIHYESYLVLFLPVSSVTGFYWPIFSRIRTELQILSLYGRIQVSEHPTYFMQYGSHNFTGLHSEKYQKFLYIFYHLFV